MLRKSIALPTEHIRSAHVALVKEICDNNRCSLQTSEAVMEGQRVLVITVTCDDHWNLAEAFFLIGGTIPFQVFHPVIIPQNMMLAELVG